MDEIVDIIDSNTTKTTVQKIDDVNRKLGKIYDCVKESKNSLPKAERIDSGLSTNFADHLHEVLHRDYYQNLIIKLG